MRIARLTFGIIVGTVTLVLLIVFGHQLYVARRAKMFLRDFKALQLQVSSFADVRNLETTYGGFESDAKSDSDKERKCDDPSEVCLIRFDFSNTWLTNLHLARFSALSAIVYVDRNVVYDRGLTYEFSDGSHPRAYSIADDGSHRLTWTKCLEKDRVIFLGTNASQQDRDEAYSMNLSCLRRFGACGNADNIIPIAAMRKMPVCGAPISP
jgi:hypothetical protein